MKYNHSVQKELNKLTRELLSGKSFDSPENEIISITTVLQFHEWRYYVLNDPVISDFEYDTLYKRLESIEHNNPKLISPDSPTQRVSSDLTNNFASVSHLVPMLSLDNSYNAQDLKDFDTQIRKLASLDDKIVIDYHVEPKFDGGSLSVIYEHNRYARAATRGNGLMGEEITNNAKVIKSIPLKADFLEYGIHTIELRGEVVIRKDNFLKINEQREREGLSVFANPRNTATGGLRMKDPKEVSQRALVAFIYQIGTARDGDGNENKTSFKTQYESLTFLKNLGFKIPEKERKQCKGIDEVIAFCSEWEEKRETYPYEIDGMVVKVDRIDIQDKCGATAHHPRWAIAYKFKAKQATTILESVEYQIGKIGSVTPVAKVAPTQLAGVTVSSISLHNEDFITSKDLRIGDTVLIERAGDVIPYIVKALPDLRSGDEVPIKFPSNCPVCNTPLIRAETEAAWRCVNPNCEAQILQRIIFHVSKPAMDIDGLGKSLVERFFELGLVKSIADIYRLDYEQISKLEGFGKKSVENLRNSINRAKANPIHRFLHSLSIHHLGQKASKLIAGQINHVLELKDWKLEDYTQIKDIGPVVAENIIGFFQLPENIELLLELEALGVNLAQKDDDRPKAINTDGPLFGKTILFTGSLKEVTRKQAQELASAAGASLLSGVSKKLDILVAGEKAGSKLNKALSLGTVEIWSEDEFLSKTAG